MTTLPDGATVTINADKSCAVVQNGNVYYFTARGDLTAPYIASAGLWLNIDRKTGTMTTMDNTGGIVGSTNLQVDPHGNLIILDPASGSQLGFLFNSDNGSLIMTDPNGDQTVILHAQPDRNPAVVRFNDNGVETMTSISADGATLTSEVIMVTGGTTTPIYTSESIFNADGSISRLRNDSDGTELTSYYDALTWDTTSDWNNLETGKSGTLVTESNGNQLGTWDNDDGTHGSVSYDATNQNLNMDWINADQSSVT